MEANYNGDKAFFRGKLLLLPAEATGNVGQLAVDLIIHNARLECLGVLRASHSVLPCVGSDPYSASDSMSSELQIYGKLDAGFVVLQQRGCTALGRQASFATALVDFIQSEGFDKVLLLGSLNSAERRGSFQNTAPIYKCSCPDAFNLDASSWQELEDNDPNRGTPYSDQQRPPFPFLRAADARQLPVCLLLIPVNEGDNTLDSMALASFAEGVLGHPASIRGNVSSARTWVVPPSWNVFGQQRVVY